MVDTIGIDTLEAVSYLVGKMTSWAGPNIPLHFHGHNDFGLATASAVSAVQAGATWIQGSIDGIGERRGNGNIPEIALAMELA
jgi:isopropylmalate/homocitrate/citramalate synthase